MVEAQPEAGAAAVAAAGETLLLALQGTALVREALASAAVALYSAAALPAEAPAAVARCFAHGLLLAGDGGGAAPELLLPGEGVAAAAAPAPCGLLDAHLQRRGSGRGLAAELQQLPPLNRICAIRGLLATMPAAVSCAPLTARWPGSGAQQQPWLLLLDGALPAIAAAIQVRRCRAAALQLLDSLRAAEQGAPCRLASGLNCPALLPSHAAGHH